MELTQTRKTESYPELLKKMIFFILPLMATSVLQLLFNTADTLVVGRWGGATVEAREAALAAVGSCGPLINLCIGFFIGLSNGVSITVARAVGRRDPENAERTLHTATVLALSVGAVVSVLCFLFAPVFLRLTGVEDAVLSEAVPYMRAYFVGLPASMLYNYAAGALRAVGDTKHPLTFLTVAGVTNIVLNVILVVAFDAGALGVGVATAASQWISCILCMIFLATRCEDLHFSVRKLRVHKREMADILYLGIPAGITSSLFSVSNVLLQSSVNSFGRVVMAGCAAAGNIEGYVWMVQDSVYHAAITFIGQSWGAGNTERMKKSIFLCIGTVFVIGIVAGGIGFVAGVPLLGLFCPGSPDAIAAALPRYRMLMVTDFLGGQMNVSSGILRGMGMSIVPMVTTLVGSCLSRVIWIYTFFPTHRTIFWLYLIYPISWGMTGLVQYLISIKKFRTLKKKLSANAGT